jgi:hypothetical protein
MVLSNGGLSLLGMLRLSLLCVLWLSLLGMLRLSLLGVLWLSLLGML